MDIKKEGVFQPSIKSIILFYITPSNRDGIELQRNCSNKKPQNAITVMYLFIIDIPPRILANVNCPHSAIGIHEFPRSRAGHNYNTTISNMIQ